MKTFLLPLVCVISITLGFASDHNNIDKERPLRFDDAFALGFRSVEIQNGIRLDGVRRQLPTFNLRSEFQWGFAKNRDVSIGFEPVFRAESGRLSAPVVEMSYFENLRREIGLLPALGFRIDVENPNEDALRARVRGIATKSFGPLGKLHVNLDMNNIGGLTDMSATLGYSSPIGVPSRFETTILAEISWQRFGSSFGLGLRKQVNRRGVLDVGIQTDLAAGRGQFTGSRLTVGYSLSL